MMRVAVVGLGWMGKVHLRNYSEMQGVEVAGVADIDPKALEEARERFNVPTFTSVEDLLEQNLDAISVCVPTSLHHATGMAVIKRGVPLLIEKPLAATVAEGRELVETAEKAGVPLMVGHIERFNPAVGRVKELIGDDAISITIERVGPYPPRIQDVGVVKDLGSHDVDLVRWLTGSEYESVYAVTSTSIGKHEDTALITARMKNGVLANISTNWITPYKSRTIHVACKSKYIEANLINQEVKEFSSFSTYDKSYSVREWPLVWQEPVKQELTAFLGAIREGREVPITGRDGLKVLETLEKVFECAC